MEENIVDSSTASGIDFLMGLWLIAAPFLLSYPTMSAYWNDIFVGMLIGGIGLVRMILPEKNTNWLSWMSTLLGFWLVIAPFVLHYQTIFAIGNDVILGTVVATMSLWSIETAATRSIYRKI